MAHDLQVRYSSMVDAKLRAKLVTRDGVVFNTRYEGQPTAGSVKIPVRDTEVVAATYDPATGIAITQGSTSYITLVIAQDKAVNELIDGYQADAVPDDIVADRLDSAGYVLASVIDAEAIDTLEAEGTTSADTVAMTAATIYTQVVAMRTALSNANVPTSDRWLIVDTDVEGVLLDSPKFTSASTLGDSVVQSGEIGMIAGFKVFVSNDLTAGTEAIAGHPDWCVRVEEWKKEPYIQDLGGSGTYIGASAVQGRKVFDHTVTKSETVIVKTAV